MRTRFESRAASAAIALGVVAACKGKQAPNEIVINLDRQVVEFGHSKLAYTGVGRDEWLVAVADLSLGLSAAQPQLTTSPRPDDGLPTECDDPKELLEALTGFYRDSNAKCGGQVHVFSMGPVAFVQCQLPPTDNTIACPTYYRAFVWGEIDGSTPAIDGPNGRRRFTFAVSSLAFVSATCGRGGPSFHKADIAVRERVELENKGRETERFFERCKAVAKSTIDGGLP